MVGGAFPMSHYLMGPSWFTLSFGRDAVQTDNRPKGYFTPNCLVAGQSGEASDDEVCLPGPS